MSWDVTLAVLGLVVPVSAALYEFAFKGRKRLGYRVQMDTTATDLVHSAHTGALQQLRLGDGARPLVNPSFVLLRVENNGVTDIDTHDYARPDEDRVGVTVEFPGRTVAGIVVTEVSADFLMDSFGANSGLGYSDGVISLPRVPLNRGAHYKVLAALEGAETPEGGRREAFQAPRIQGGIKGGVGSGAIQETKKPYRHRQGDRRDGLLPRGGDRRAARGVARQARLGGAAGLRQGHRHPVGLDGVRAGAR